MMVSPRVRRHGLTLIPERHLAADAGTTESAAPRGQAADRPRPKPAFVPELSLPVSEATLVRPTPERRAPISGFVAHLAHMLIGAPVYVWAALDGIIAFNAIKIAHYVS